MSYCAPMCNVPCGVGYGYGGVGSCGLVPAYGVGGALSGGGFGVGGGLSGGGAGFGYGSMACSTQVAGSEVVVQPPASVISLPGPILSSTGEPAVVSAITPCSGYGYGMGSSGGFSSGSSSGGYGRLGYGGGYGSGYCGGYGSWRRYSRRPYYRSGSCDPC